MVGARFEHNNIIAYHCIPDDRVHLSLCLQSASHSRPHHGVCRLPPHRQVKQQQATQGSDPISNMIKHVHKIRGSQSLRNLYSH